MRTSRTISNIAYHRPEVFSEKVAELRASGAIGPCFWVAHKGEGGDKDHIHVILLGGCKCYQTDGLSSLFGIDVFPDGSKGSCTAIWKYTKDVSDWILYGIHCEEYLALKNETKEFHYTFEDIHCSPDDEDVLRVSIIEARERLEAIGDRVVVTVKRMFAAGCNLPQVLASGLVPIGCIGNVVRLWEALEHLPPKQEIARG